MTLIVIFLHQKNAIQIITFMNVFKDVKISKVPFSRPFKNIFAFTKVLNSGMSSDFHVKAHVGVPHLVSSVRQEIAWILVYCNGNLWLNIRSIFLLDCKKNRPKLSKETWNFSRRQFAAHEIRIPVKESNKGKNLRCHFYTVIQRITDCWLKIQWHRRYCIDMWYVKIKKIVESLTLRKFMRFCICVMQCHWITLYLLRNDPVNHLKWLLREIIMMLTCCNVLGTDVPRNVYFLTQ